MGDIVTIPVKKCFRYVLLHGSPKPRFFSAGEMSETQQKELVPDVQTHL